MRILTGLAAGLALSVLISFPSYAGHWVHDKNGWWWQEEDKSYPRDTWKWLDGDGDCLAECYYFDRDGYLVSDSIVGKGYEVNEDGAWVEDGQVQQIIVPYGGNVIGTDDYLISLPESWEGNFYISQTEDCLRVYFYPSAEKPREIFEVHRVGSLEEKKKLLTEIESKKELGWCRGNYYISGTPEHPSLTGYGPGEREMIRLMTEDYKKNMTKYFEFQ
ncbi:MAG TPA: hypothetical protein H9716_06780 [Candidatus Enterocloster faecavium]|uniref:WG repeat-containing protein n=1 Tax=Candidatus Enterocloster faecavium TaxID=2838560 RepID=A0A9D2L7R0_9FIRM|nr:hypothetical protein [Candidatus Enterocloster faecavium]